MACFQAQAKMWALIPMAEVFVFPLFVSAKCFNILLHKRTCTHVLHQGVNTCTHLLYLGVSAQEMGTSATACEQDMGTNTHVWCKRWVQVFTQRYKRSVLTPGHKRYAQVVAPVCKIWVQVLALRWKRWIQALMPGYKRWAWGLVPRYKLVECPHLLLCRPPEAIFGRRIFSSVSLPPLDTGCEQLHLSMSNGLQSFSFPTAFECQKLKHILLHIVEFECPLYIMVSPPLNLHSCDKSTIRRSSPHSHNVTLTSHQWHTRHLLFARCGPCTHMTQ